jgi:hypothetical protein
MLKDFFNPNLLLQNANTKHTLSILYLLTFNVIWRQIYFCWSEFLFFAENFVIERENILESSDKSREILSLFLGRPLQLAETPNS